MHHIMIGQSPAKDIIPIFSGYEACESAHKYGPHARRYHLIHFCLQGKGKLQDRFGTHKIGAGELFIIRPGEITTYIADTKDPWEYMWVAFHGDMASVFDTERSVYAFSAEIGMEMRRLVQEKATSPAAFISLIYKLIDHLFGEKKNPPDIITSVKQYINFHYMNDLSVAKLSEEFGYERSYLYRIFKAACGMSIKDYIVKTRMEAALPLLAKGYTVKSTALAVGYGDPFSFSKVFKQHYGMPPKAKKS